MATQTRKPTVQRREEIVQAVLRIIGERGLTALSTSTLAEEVGLTTGALFRHFATREAMLEAAADYALARIDETFPDATLPPRERLLQLAHNRVRLLGANPGLAWLLRSEQAYLTLPADSVNELRALVRRSRRFLLEALRDGISQGEFRRDLEPEEMLVPVMGTIHALIGMPGAHRSRRQPDTERILNGLLTMLAPIERKQP
jgi:AcrR family transcriptional regulator